MQPVNPLAPPPRKPFFGLGWGGLLFVCLMVGIVLIAVAANAAGPEDAKPAAAPTTAGAPTTTVPTTKTDHSGLACDHFRNVAKDFSDGILTMGELRGKLAEVNDSAKGIATDEVQASATAMLAAITAGDEPTLSVAIGQMDAACEAAGH